jgi:hypothetical protein
VRRVSLKLHRPGLEPPGGTFKQAILHGFSFRPEEELKAIILEVCNRPMRPSHKAYIEQASNRFQGTSYNLLTKNCNHFTSYLCERLTSRPAPNWLNRAASIGVALPCVVPREWIAPPDHDTADGELLDEDFEDERSSMLRSDQRQRHRASEDEDEDRDSEVDGLPSGSTGGDGGSAGGHPRHSTSNHAPRLVPLKDTSNREVPPAERAPVPRSMT